MRSMRVQSKVIIDVCIWAKTINYKMVKIKKNNFINAKNILNFEKLILLPIIDYNTYTCSIV